MRRRILYMLRGQFGMIGTNASFMIPHHARASHEVRVLDFEPVEADRGANVFQDPALDIVTYPRLPLQHRLPALVEQLEAFEPDTVHVFYHSMAMPLAYFAKALTGRPSQWIVDIRTPPLAIDSVVRDRENRRNALSAPYWDHVVTHARSSARAVLPRHHEQALVSAPGVSPHMIAHRKVGRKGPHRKLVYVGSASKLRRLDLLVDWIADFAKSHTMPFHLDIFGIGNGLNDYKTLAMARGLDTQVTFCGHVDQATLAGRLPEYDAGLCYIPNGPFEVAPALNFLEYAASGLTILSSRTAGMLANVNAGFAAHLFDNEARSFGAALRTLLEHEPDEVSLERNHALVSRMTWKEIVHRDYLPLYASPRLGVGLPGGAG